MNRTVLSAVIALCAVIIFIPAPSGAMSLGVGATTWYAWWQPAWAEGESTGVGPGSFDWEIDPSIMAGPIISLGVTDSITLSSVLVFGKYEASTSIPAALETWSRDVTKYEIDTTLAWRVMPMVSLFAGLKFLGYRYDETHETTMGTYNGESNFDGYGPGIGGSVTLPVTGNLFASLSASFIYLINNYENKPPVGGSYSSDVTGYGGNASLSLMYLFPGYNTVISAGLRYQAIKFSQDEVIGGQFNYDGNRDHFYGVTVSAIYTFNL
ncbi:MAG TPA: hypothetical protein PKY31_17390 [Spirochaetota bacterium]|nr:hypothetical protein [Spirochaetota bacterium]